MSATTMPYYTSSSGAMKRLIRAGLLTGISDAIWAMVATVFVFHRGSAASVWRGVASVLVGKDALTGGVPAAALGLVMHFGVAFSWSAIFLLLVTRSHWLRAVLDSPYGVLKVAAVYGPFIWVFMSFVFIPLFTHRLPTVTVIGGSSSSATCSSSAFRSSGRSAPDRVESSRDARIAANEFDM